MSPATCPRPLGADSPDLLPGDLSALWQEDLYEDKSDCDPALLEHGIGAILQPALPPSLPPTPYRPTVCVDLDGVLAEYETWLGLEHIGKPLPGAVAFTKQLSDVADVLIYTTRCQLRPDKQEWLAKHHPGATSREAQIGVLKTLVKTWLDQHGFVYHGIFVGQGKPLAVAYVDDRGVRCRPQEEGQPAFWQALEQVKFLLGN